MKTLLKNINTFYKRYDLSHPFKSIKLTKADMYNHDTLMSVYESIWETMEFYEVKANNFGQCSDVYEWLIALYGELGDYIVKMPSPYKWQSQTMGNLVCTFGEVIRQAWDSLVHYHTIDLKWSYNKRGF